MKNLTIILITIIVNSITWAVCTTGNVNTLRSEPTTRSAKLKLLPRYTPLEIIERKDSWLYVHGYDYKGWIYQKLVTEDISCMLILGKQNIDCVNKTPKPRKKRMFLSAVKVLKKEIGCNFVQDKYGHKFWLNSINIWPADQALRISF